MKKKIILILLICFSVLLVKSKIVYAADTCGSCGLKYGYEYTSTGKGYHGVRQGCACGASTGIENCSGGTATCTSQAKCSKCGASYGSYGAHSYVNNGTCNGKKCSVCLGTMGSMNHSYGSWSYYNGNQHRAKCLNTGCRSGNPYKYENHNYVQKYNDTQHYMECTGCGDIKSETNHSFDTSNATNHTCSCGKTEAHSWNISKATCEVAKKCNKCGFVIENALGHNYSRIQRYEKATIGDNKHNIIKACVNAGCSSTTIEVGNCSGGTANCTTRAICSNCGDYYGSIAPNNHNYTKACPKCATANVVCSRDSNHVASHDCTIYVDPPTVKATHVYTGSAITAVPAHSNGYYTRSGTYSATNVGVYTAKVILKSGTGPAYKWKDTRTAEQRTYTWSILDTAIAISNQPSDGNAKEGGTVTFRVNATGSHIRYQWYYSSTANSTGGTLISGATQSTYTTPAVTRDMNNRYYYCVLSNNSTSATSLTSVASATAKLTVWWTHEISAHPKDIKVKKDETAYFSVTAVGGNPTNYTYQWYTATSPTSTGTVINGAINNTYSYLPKENIHEKYFYCNISNGYYTVTSNRAKLVADITCPTINIGTPSKAYVNSNTKFNIIIYVTDTGEGFNTSTFTSSDIIVRTNNITISPTLKELTFNSNNGNTYQYTLTLQGITGDGIMTLDIPSGSVADNLGNPNLATSMVVTGLVVDNTSPVIASNGAVTGTNAGYINKDDTITIPMKITDIGGIEPSEFAKEDIIVKTDGTEVADAIISVSYIGKEGNDYKYNITITNITKEGVLTLEIPASKINDKATNGNIKTTISGLDVIVDNTPPKITKIVLSLDSFNSSQVYPSSLPSTNETWINKDVYAVVIATDEGRLPSGVETYWHSEGNTSNFIKLTGDREIWQKEINNTVYYRVIDKAGNISESSSVQIKIDKTAPIVAELNMRHARENGLPYVYDVSNPASDSIYIKPMPTTDTGSHQSGILKTEYIVTFNDGVDTIVYDTLDSSVSTLLRKTGTYDIEVITTDKAGNVSSKIFKAIIEKKVENTVKIKNLHDEGSGVEKITITAKKQGATTYAIEPIIINKPGANITERIKLADGTYVIRVEIEDGVGLITTLEETIVNVLN